MSKFILVLISAFGLMLLSGAAHTEVLSNRQFGIEITKPDNWHTMHGSGSVKHAVQPQGQTDKLDRLIKAMASANPPAVVITKFREPYPYVNPSVSIGLMTFPSDVTVTPLAVLKAVKEGMQHTMKGVSFRAGPAPASLAKLPSAIMQYDIENVVRGAKYRSAMEMWVVIAKGRMVVIDAGASTDEPASTRAELKKIVQSLRLN